MDSEQKEKLKELLQQIRREVGDRPQPSVACMDVQKGNVEILQRKFSKRIN